MPIYFNLSRALPDNYTLRFIITFRFKINTEDIYNWEKIPFCDKIWISHYRYAIESPRWLINQKRFTEAIRQFKIIAQVNKRKFDLTEEKLEQMFSDQPVETVYGMASLFCTWRMTKNTIIMGFSWCVAAVSFFVLVLFSAQMGGNPFLNFLFQSVVEVPAYILGKYVGKFCKTIYFNFNLLKQCY